MLLPKQDGLKLTALATLFLLFALATREFLRLMLVTRGASAATATDASTFAGIVVLATTMWPLFRRFHLSLADFFQRPVSIPATIVAGLIGGVLCRLLDWVLLLTTNGHVGQLLSATVSCATPEIESVAIVALALPLAEEITHRGAMLTGLAPLGTVTAVLVTALLFAVLHTTLLSPFVFGVVSATVALRTGSLWVPLIAHCTFNMLSVAEAACLQVVTNDPDGFRFDWPLALTLAAVLMLFLAALIRLSGTGALARPDAFPTGR